MNYKDELSIRLLQSGIEPTDAILRFIDLETIPLKAKIFVLQNDGKLFNEGEKLTIEKLKSYGFQKDIITDRDGDEQKWWYKNGISIHENSWWLNEKEGTSKYKESETPPEITFCFATYVKSDGGFKGGFSVLTDKQLENIYFSLTNQILEKNAN